MEVEHQNACKDLGLGIFVPLFPTCIMRIIAFSLVHLGDEDKYVEDVLDHAASYVRCEMHLNFLGHGFLH